MGSYGVISPLIWILTIVTLLLARKKTPHEPPSNTERYSKTGLRGTGGAWRPLPQSLVKETCRHRAWRVIRSLRAGSTEER